MEERWVDKIQNLVQLAEGLYLASQTENNNSPKGAEIPRFNWPFRWWLVLVKRCCLCKIDVGLWCSVNPNKRSLVFQFSLFSGYGHEETSVCVDREWVNHLKIWKELVPTRMKNLLWTLYLLSISTVFHDLRNWTEEIKQQKVSYIWAKLCFYFSPLSSNNQIL